MSIISIAVPNTPHINNSKEGFYFHDTVEVHTRRMFSKKENDLINEMMVKHHAFICGGFAAHCFAMEAQVKMEYGDVDFYFNTEEDFNAALLYVKAITGYSDHQLEPKPYMGETTRAATFDMGGRTYQLIRATFGSIEEIFNTFDFTNSKVGIVYNPTDLSTIEYVLDSKFPKLLEKKIVEYRVQQHLTLETLKDKQNHAKGNIRRLEKYLDRYPAGFLDEESKTQMLQQYAWDFKFDAGGYHSPGNTPNLCKLLMSATQDQLILFFPFGGEWKRAFETSGKSLERFLPNYKIEMNMTPDMQVSLGDPSHNMMWSMIAEKIKGAL